MTWPTDTLTVASLDGDTDTLPGADKARHELHQAVLRLKDIIGSAASGSTPWTDANDAQLAYTFGAGGTQTFSNPQEIKLPDSINLKLDNTGTATVPILQFLLNSTVKWSWIVPFGANTLQLRDGSGSKYPLIIHQSASTLLLQGTSIKFNGFELARRDLNNTFSAVSHFTGFVTRSVHYEPTSPVTSPWDVDWETNGNIQQLAISGNTTLNFIEPGVGCDLVLMINGSGDVTFTTSGAGVVELPGGGPLTVSGKTVLHISCWGASFTIDSIAANCIA